MQQLTPDETAATTEALAYMIGLNREIPVLKSLLQSAMIKLAAAPTCIDCKARTIQRHIERNIKQP